jgi:hypothetical protein
MPCISSTGLIDEAVLGAGVTDSCGCSDTAEAEIHVDWREGVQIE